MEYHFNRHLRVDSIKSLNMKIIQPLVLTLLLFFSIAQCFSQVSDSTVIISTSAAVYKKGDDLKITVSGFLYCTGDCNASPLLGLLKKNGTNWDTLVAVNSLSQLDCGLAMYNFQNQTFTIYTIGFTLLAKYLAKGEYRFSVLTGDKRKVLYSRPFIVER